MGDVVESEFLCIQCHTKADAMCDNDCGTHHCEICDIDFYCNSRGEKCIGHDPYCLWISD